MSHTKSSHTKLTRAAAGVIVGGALIVGLGAGVGTAAGTPHGPQGPQAGPQAPGPGGPGGPGRPGGPHQGPPPHGPGPQHHGPGPQHHQPPAPRPGFLFGGIWIPFVGS